MGYNIEVQKFTIHVPEHNVRARDLAWLLGATNALYDAIAIIFVFDSGRFVDGQLKALPDDALLRVTSIHSGSDISLSLLGVDRVLDAFRRVVNEFRFRKERKKREEEKTKQEEETTWRMRIENVQRALGTFTEFKSLSPEERAQFLRLIQGPLTEIDENRNWIE